MFGPIKRKAKEKVDPEEKQREQEETARVYAEFVRSFQGNSDELPTHHFVRGGLINPNSSIPSESVEASSEPKRQTLTGLIDGPKKKLWVPPPSSSLQQTSAPSSWLQNTATLRSDFGEGIGGFSSITTNACESQPILAASSSSKPREIDTFLEEIKRKQELLDQKKQLRQLANCSEESERDLARKKLQYLEESTRGKGSIPGVIEAEETSNLYLGNLSPDVTEEFLCQQFGKFGTIASVKIMYPRPEEERVRRRHCGFVSFENRAMAEAAKNYLDGNEFCGMPIRISWGKAVTRLHATSHPIIAGIASVAGAPLSIPRELHSGGFTDASTLQVAKSKKIKVVIPLDPRQKAVIDIVAQYVIEDGYPLESLLAQKGDPSKNQQIHQEINALINTSVPYCQ